MQHPALSHQICIINFEWLANNSKKDKSMKGRSWWVIALIFVGIFATVSGLIYLAIRLTREQRRSGNKGPYMPPASIIPPPISWAYDTFVSTLPQSGVINDNIIPNCTGYLYEKGRHDHHGD